MASHYFKEMPATGSPPYLKGLKSMLETLKTTEKTNDRKTWAPFDSCELWYDLISDHLKPLNNTHLSWKYPCVWKPIGGREEKNCFEFSEYSERPIVIGFENGFGFPPSQFSLWKFNYHSPRVTDRIIIFIFGLNQIEQILIWREKICLCDWPDHRHRHPSYP